MASAPLVPRSVGAVALSPHILQATYTARCKLLVTHLRMLPEERIAWEIAIDDARAHGTVHDQIERLEHILAQLQEG